MRKKRAVINVLSGIGGQFFTQFLGFIVRTVFIYSLGREYLGINGLFTNILSLLSLAELGIGSAITYYLYKPLQEKDARKISAYMLLYKKIYTVVGISIIFIGILLMPFLRFFIKELPTIDNLNFIYLLFLFNTGVSYFFSYYVTLLIADQKQYKTVITSQLVNIIKSIIQIYVLIVLKNYYLYLITMILSTVGNNFILARIARREYKDIFRRKSERLTQKEYTDLKKYIGATFLHKMGSIVVFNTDNLLISYYVGITYVGITSNYFMIIQMLSTFIDQIFQGMIASVGNLNSVNNIEHSLKIYKVLDFFVFCFYTICCLNLFNLINPFIDFWIGNEYLLPKEISFLIVLNFFINGLRKSNLMYIDTMGLQWITRKKPVFESLFNLFFSIILLKSVGLIGVFWGTLLSTLICSLFYEPVILFKYGFNRGVFHVFIKYLRYFLIMAFCYLTSNYFISMISGNGLFELLLNAVISTLIPIIVLNVLFWNTMEHDYLKKIIINIKKM